MSSYYDDDDFGEEYRRRDEDAITWAIEEKERSMADHGENYVRMKADDGSEIGSLPPECGHHCGVITVGHSDRHAGHCPCPECHDGAYAPARASDG